MNGDPSICNGCGGKEPEIRFTLRKSGNKNYRNHLCIKCRSQYRKKYPLNPDVIKRASLKIQARRKKERKLKEYRHKFIYGDCKRYDKRKGLKFNLSLDF